MIRHLGFRIAAATLGMLLSVSTALAAPISIDLSTWSVVQYFFPSQGNANWVLSNANTTATQTVNADASILLNDFDITGQQIEGSWRVNTGSDDDFMGFVFGYQGRDEYYLFDWKQGTQSAFGVSAERGMSLKVVDVIGGGDPSGQDLWQGSGISTGTANVTILRHNTIPWADFIEYDFRLNFTPGLFEIEVLQGVTQLENWVVADSTYTNGMFGFYNYSQGTVVYNGFTREPEPPPIAAPEFSGKLYGMPNFGWIISLGGGLLGLVGIRRKKLS